VKNKQQHPWLQKDWLASHIMLDLFLESILKRIKLYRQHDIPYLAGYSQNCKTIYINRHMPESFVNKKGHIIKTDRFLILHEAVEKTLIEQLVLRYQLAHQIALRAEKAAVRADKISWKEYDKFTQNYIKELDSEKLSKVLEDLDIKPYHAEHDAELIARMDQAVQRNQFRVTTKDYYC
jgi:hypothetical protein